MVSASWRVERLCSLRYAFTISLRFFMGRCPESDPTDLLQNVRVFPNIPDRRHPH
jgi:hypothetical protein